MLTYLNNETFPAIRKVERANTADERKKIEARSIMQMINRCHEAAIRSHDESELIDSFLEVLITSGRYVSAWVGLLPFVEDDEYAHLACKGPCGHCPASSWLIYGKDGIACPVLRYCEMSAESTAGLDLANCPVASAGKKMSVYTFSLINKGKAIGFLYVCSKEDRSFKNSEISLLQDLAEGLSYGIASRRKGFDDFLFRELGISVMG